MDSENNSSSLRAIIGVTLAVSFWGASFIATKIALRELAPVTAVWLRFGIGLLVLGAAVGKRRQFAWPQREEVGYFALLGFLGIAFHQWLQSNGLVTALASTTAWIVAATPVNMALLGRLALGERLRLIGWGGIFTAMLGVLLIVTRGDLSQALHGNLGEPGNLLIMISTLNWAVFSVLSRRGLQSHPAARMMFFVMLFGWGFTSLQFFMTQSLSSIATLSPSGWGAIAFLGIACSGLAYIFWYDALQALPAAQVGAFLYLEPLVSTLIAAWLLNEALLPAMLLGGMLILLGVTLVNRSKG